LERGYGRELVAEVVGESFELEAEGGVVFVSAVSSGVESAMTDGVMLVNGGCAEKVVELRRVCGKKCSKVK